MSATPTSPTSARRSALGAARVITRTELRLIVRSKATLVSATAFPFLFAGFVMLQAEAARNAAVGMISMILAFFALFAIYLTATTTLVTRRQDLFLKRLRSGETSDGAILAGLLGAPLVLFVAQSAVVAVVLVFLDVPGPARPWWIVLAVVGLVASTLAASTATAAITPNPSAAQISTTPYMLVVLGSLIAAPLLDHAWFDLTPGGAVVTLVRSAYELDVAGSPWFAIAGLALWTWLGVDLTRRHFRWEPRH
ncbi:transport permease protein [Aeromicrobium flavum]|uniref:Transport permease protein n=1 Tax=Aeromicrobium flavum TaxID=416568 RepID=A0A512HTY8_9ACTN|nr:ABC transporter permease [Aeromicrobium flavum]GEO88916.1 transport permease protein [Aeromicrobium flavum]